MSHLYNQNNTEIITCNEKTVEAIKQHVRLLTLFLKETSSLTESYILVS